MNHRDLTNLFGKLGAREPSQWAASQLEEGIPQLARFLFLRQAWRGIVAEGDSGWIDAEVRHAEQNPEEPYAGVGHALARLRSVGASQEDLTDVVRGMQAQLLFHLCSLLDDPGDLEPEVDDLAWTLVQLDGEDKIVAEINGLHESVLETDPTGRELRPRPTGE